jgi:hypothetical protein
MPLFKLRDLGIDIVLVGRGDLGSEPAKGLEDGSLSGVCSTYQTASVIYLDSF